MDSNYEAQKHLANQRLTTRRQQAMGEQLLRSSRPSRPGFLRRVFSRLFRHPACQRGEPAREPKTRPAIEGGGR
jgi:hypothetical protein